MKSRFRSVVLALCLATALAACGTSPSSPADLNREEAIALRSATVAKQTATTLLDAGKITVAQDVKAQAAANAIVVAIRAARAQGDIATIQQKRVEADAIAANPAGVSK